MPVCSCGCWLASIDLCPAHNNRCPFFFPHTQHHVQLLCNILVEHKRYNVKDYFSHWLDMPSLSAKSLPEGTELKLPKIFHTNWFMRDDDGGFLWFVYS